MKKAIVVKDEDEEGDLKGGKNRVDVKYYTSLLREEKWILNLPKMFSIYTIHVLYF
jgi:hypothetical protein